MNYFSPDETKCRCGCGLDILPALRDVMNEIREEVGGPLRVNSGARCFSYNAKIGGAPGSYHIRQMAVDFACTDSILRAKIVKAALNRGMRVEWGTKTWVHCDLGTPQRIFSP